MNKTRIVIDKNGKGHWNDIEIGHIIRTEEGEEKLFLTAPVDILEKMIRSSDTTAREKNGE